MTNPKFKHLTLGVIAVTASLIPFLAAKTAHAAVFVDGWSYSMDSFDDSMRGSNVGGTDYEIYGMAMKQTADEVIFAINSNLGIGGIGSEYAEDGHVGWGDLLLNFTGQNLDTASATSQLLGIRWAGNNDSGAPQLGVYENVSATAIANQNGLLLDNLQEYNDWVRDHGSTPSIGDLAANDPYFNPNRHIQNVIAAGTRIGDVNVLGNMGNLGVNFGQFGATGTHTLGFSIARSLLPDGAFIAHLAPECDNDVTAMLAALYPPAPEPPQDVPEPGMALSLLGLGGLVGAFRLRRGNLQSKLG